jgi:paraquat-inducible protein B
VEPEIGLVGSKHLTELLDGAFIGILPSHKPNMAFKDTFTALALAPTVKALPYGLNIKLTAAKVSSVRVGNPVLYRQIKVGEVIGIDLSPTSDEVNIFINIADRYAPLVNPNSKFWNTSGIDIDAGIFSGININSESIETLIAGGIAFASPEMKATSMPGHNVNLPTSYILHQDLDEDWLDWRPVINIDKPSH